MLHLARLSINRPRAALLSWLVLALALSAVGFGVAHLDKPAVIQKLKQQGVPPLETGEPDLRANRLNLDTGAVFGGPLTAALFTAAQTEPVSFVQAG